MSVVWLISLALSRKPSPWRPTAKIQRDGRRLPARVDEGAQRVAVAEAGGRHDVRQAGELVALGELACPPFSVGPAGVIGGTCRVGLGHVAHSPPNAAGVIQ